MSYYEMNWSSNWEKNWPEDYLWVSTGDGTGWLVDRDRLSDLAYGGAAPRNETEALLVNNPEWLDFYVQHVNGEYPITILAGGPLPEWEPSWVEYWNS